jgi:hypothetical protein
VWEELLPRPWWSLWYVLLRTLVVSVLMTWVTCRATQLPSPLFPIYSTLLLSPSSTPSSRTRPSFYSVFLVSTSTETFGLSAPTPSPQKMLPLLSCGLKLHCAPLPPSSYPFSNHAPTCLSTAKPLRTRSTPSSRLRWHHISSSAMCSTSSYPHMSMRARSTPCSHRLRMWTTQEIWSRHRTQYVIFPYSLSYISFFLRVSERESLKLTLGLMIVH